MSRDVFGIGAQCGVRKSRQAERPEAGDSSEATNSVEGVRSDLIRGFIMVRMMAFVVDSTPKVIDFNQHL